MIKGMMSRSRAFLGRTAERLGYRISKINTSDSHLYDGFSSDSISKRRFMNVGAGDFNHPFWTNVDFETEWYSEAQKVGFVNFDLTKCEPLPFEEGSFEAIYSSHTIEHVPNDAVESFVSESYRTLRHGGTLRITCPDARLLVRSVRLGRLDYWKWREEWFCRPYSTNPEIHEITLSDYLLREIATERCRFYLGSKNPIEPEEVMSRIGDLSDEELLDWMTSGLKFNPESPGNHINWWTYEKLDSIAKEVGFKNTYLSGRGQSLCRPMTNLDFFDSTAPHDSLYFEAIR